jgi:hypothetical protein
MMFHLSPRALTAFALACVLGLSAAVPARAAYTDVKPPDPWNETPEDGHRTILSTIYGGTFQRFGPGNVNMTNGTVTAHRIEDSMSPNGVLGMVDGEPGSAADQVWHDGFTDAFAKVRFARDSQSLGYWEGTSGGTYTKLFDVQGQGYAVTGGIPLADMTGKTWRWGRSRGRGGIHSSVPAENPDGLDHMVTYQVTGLNTEPGYTTWLLFWEDLNYSSTPNTLTTDRDVNDLVVELRAIAAPGVPEPATGALLAGAAAVFVVSRRRRNV